MKDGLYLFPELLEEEKQNFLKKLPFFENPKNDNEILLNLQKEYLTTGNKKAEMKLWEKCMEISGRMITKERKEKGFFVSDLEDKKMDAVLYLLRRYKKNNGWYVRKSFISAIQQAVFHSLYYDAQKNVNKIKIEYVGDVIDIMKSKESFNDSY